MAQINFKIINKDLAEVRRFAIDESLGSNFVFIKEKILEIFPNLKGANLKITWKDNEGDHITITGDEDLSIAISEMDKSAKVLYVEMGAKQNCPFGSGIDVAQLDALKGIAEQYLKPFLSANDTQSQVLAETLRGVAQHYFGKDNEQSSSSSQSLPKKYNTTQQRIEEGIEQLREMGFSNDSGLVENLLEQHGGNVESVIKILAN